jgi:hypothetical protein
MSLGVAVLGPEGVVLAADSRITLTAERPDAPPLPVNFDTATKLLSFSEPHNYVGAVTYGTAVIGLRSAHSLVPEFELQLETEDRLSVEEFASKLGEFFLDQWRRVIPEDYDGPSMVFIVGGFDRQAAYGRVFLVDIPNNPEPVERNPGETEFGMTWGGQLQIASRIIHGYDPMVLPMVQQELGLDEEHIQRLRSVFRDNLEFSIPYQVLPLQECVNLATFMIRSTISAQNLAVGVRGVGGPIDIAVIRRTTGLQYVKRKSIDAATEQSQRKGRDDVSPGSD